MLPTSKRQLRLSAKFVLLTVAALSLTLGATAVYMVNAQQQQFMDQLQKQGQVLGGFASLISPEPILAYDFDTLESYIKVISNSSDVVYAVAYDSSGANLTSYLKPNNALVLRAVQASGSSDVKRVVGFLNQDDEVMPLKFPIVQGAHAIGYLLLGMDRKDVRMLAQRTLIQYAIVYALIIGILSLCIYIVFRQQTLRPIMSLMQGSERVAKDDYSTPVHIYAHDEMGQLAHTFNDMMAHLLRTRQEKDQAMTRLHDMNYHLEQRVYERTLELERSETRTRAIVESIGEGIVTLDDRGIVVSMNRTALELFRTDATQATGMPCSQLVSEKSGEPNTHSAQPIDAATGSLRPSLDASPYETVGHRLDGSTFPLEVIVTPMQLGDRFFQVCILRDITLRKETERRLAHAQLQLVDSAHQSGMAEIAVGVLHNVGNILNSVILSAEEIQRTVRTTKTRGLVRANELLEKHANDLSHFLLEDEKGQILIRYYLKLGQAIREEMEAIKQEVGELSEKTVMIRDVIATQQDYARVGSLVENLDIIPVIEDSIRVQDTYLKKWGITVHRQYSPVPNIVAHKSKLLQTLTNLVKNAKEATDENDRLKKTKEVEISVGMLDQDNIYVKIKDNGCGIPHDNLTRIFNHGFTTKSYGHGFGLHSSALAMTEMGGSLEVHSEGLGLGATFTVKIPTFKAKSSELHSDQTAV